MSSEEESGNEPPKKMTLCERFRTIRKGSGTVSAGFRDKLATLCASTATMQASAVAATSVAVVLVVSLIAVSMLTRKAQSNSADNTNTTYPQNFTVPDINTTSVSVSVRSTTEQYSTTISTTLSSARTSEKSTWITSQVSITSPGPTSPETDQYSLKTTTTLKPTVKPSTDIPTDVHSTVSLHTTAILSPTWNPVNTKQITANYNTEVTQMHHSIQETLPASTTLGNDQQSLNTITSSEPTQHSSTDILTDGTNLQSTTVLSQNTAILSPTWNPVNTKEITVNYKTEVTQLHHSTQETLPVSTSLGNDQQTLNTITSSEPTQQSSTDIFTAVTDLKNATVFSHTTGILFPTWNPKNTKQTTANYKTEVTDLHYFTDKTITDILTDVTDLQSTTVVSHNSEIPTSTPYPELTTTSHQTEMTSAPLSTNIGTQSHGTTIPATTIDTHSISNTKYDRRSTHTHTTLETTITSITATPTMDRSTYQTSTFIDNTASEQITSHDSSTITQNTGNTSSTESIYTRSMPATTALESTTNGEQITKTTSMDLLLDSTTPEYTLTTEYQTTGLSTTLFESTTDITQSPRITTAKPVSEPLTTMPSTTYAQSTLSEPVNLAYMKEVTGALTANAATDGDNLVCATVNVKKNPYLMVNLGKEYRIREIVLMLSPDYGRHFPDSVVRVGSEPNIMDNPTCFTINQSPAPVEIRETVDCTGMYVIVQKIAVRDGMTVCEILLYAG